MIIDWFTVVSQALNFLILIWLMKRFLYKPILRAIDAREKKIEDEVASANSQKEEAKKESEKFEKKNEDFDGERSALLAKAKDDAETERKRLKQEVREELEVFRAKKVKSITDNQQSLIDDLNQRAQAEIFSIARKTLFDLADASLEEKMLNVFIQKIDDLSSGEKKTLSKAFNEPSAVVTVRSAFEFSEGQKVSLLGAIKKFINADVSTKFEVSPGVIAGVELTGNGQRIKWSISGYLTSLEKSVEAGIDAMANSEVKNS